MRLESCIRKGLGLKAHRVTRISEQDGLLVAEIEWNEGRSLRCGQCSGKTNRVHARQPTREWRDLKVRDQELVLRYAPRRVRCRSCGVSVEKVPWAERWQRVTRALGLALARLAKLLSWKETARHYRGSPCGSLASTRCRAARGNAT